MDHESCDGMESTCMYLRATQYGTVHVALKERKGGVRLNERQACVMKMKDRSE